MNDKERELLVADRDRAEAYWKYIAERYKKQRDELRKLVIDAYDEWGGDGPPNSWRAKAESLDAWPGASMKRDNNV